MTGSVHSQAQDDSLLGRQFADGRFPKLRILWVSIVLGFGYSSILTAQEPISSPPGDSSKMPTFLESKEQAETSKSGKLRWTTSTGFEIRLGGKFHLDFTDGSSSNDHLPYDTSFRRLRFALRGKREGGVHFKIQCDFSDDGNAQFKDVYLGIELNDAIKVRVGQMKEPIGLEWLTGSNDLVTGERAPQSEMLPKREMGILAFGSLGRKSNWAFGYFLNSDDLGHASQDDEEAGQSDVTGRLTCMPWGKGKSNRYLNLGLSVSFRDWEDDRFEVESPGSLRTAPDLFNFANFGTSSMTLWEGDAALSIGRVLLQHETIHCVIHGSPETTLTGSSLTASWILTGEHRKMKRGDLSGLTPNRPFHIKAGGGACEVFGRYSILDTTDVSTRDQTLRDAVLGMSWVLMTDVRILVNGIYSTLEEGSFHQATRGVHLRFQLGF